MNILITGIHGFVGSNLVSYLKDRHTIYGLDIIAPKRDGVVQTFLWQDLAIGRLPNVDAIIHLAGKAHDTKNQTESQVYFQVNTELTKRIYDYYLQSAATNFIFFSTAKAAADRVDGILTEDVIPMPIGPYGESKIAAEQYIQAHPPIAGKSIYILRPCMIHGPGNKGNLNLLYHVVSHNIPWPLGAFENKRTFTSVSNICYVVEQLLIQEVESGIYNMGDDDAISTNELIEIICNAIGQHAHIWRISPILIRFCAKIGDILPLSLNSERLQKLTENYISSNQKIKEALHITKLPTDARSGLKLTIQSFNSR